MSALLAIAWLLLSETPGLRQSIGVGVVLVGAYLLEVEEARTGLLAPLHILLRRPGTVWAIIASALWGASTVFEKLSIEHLSPPSGPSVAPLGTSLMVVLLTPGAFFSSDQGEFKGQWSGLRAHPRALALAVPPAVLRPPLAFTGIAL